jgi:2,3-diketo-5-methylthio-1-phosphopentane phosphatase
MRRREITNLSYCRVFFDFDNTLTYLDVLDDIIQRFSVDDKWKALEKKWLEGRIGSRECLKGQLESVRVNKQYLLKYLDKIKVSPYFKKVIPLLQKNHAGPVILSDNFGFIIERILRNNGIKGVAVCANRLKIKDDRFIPSFPHTNRDCWKCAHCKTKNLKKSKFDSKIIIYVGDGHSDICPAKKADIVFAKGSLLKHFRKNHLPCRRFNELKEVYNYLKRVYDSKSENR